MPAAILLILGGTAAAASVTGEVSLLSNDMYRGRSISDGHPVATIALSYDDLAGPYAGVSATSVIASSGASGLLSVQEYAGFAYRLRPELTFDLGIVNTDYSYRWSGGRKAGYTELHAGLIGRRASARLSFSPNYLKAGWHIGYGDLNANLLSRGPWDVSAHGGLLWWISGGRPTGARALHYDWQISGGRQIGRFKIRAGWAAGGPQPDFYHGRAHRHGAPTISVAASF